MKNKFFETSQDIVDLAFEKLEDYGLAQLGLNFNVISTRKAKDILTVGRMSGIAEYILKKNDIVTIVVYEEAFDRLNDEYKNKLMEGVISNISYDFEKDNIVIDNSRYGEFIRMRRKYPNYGDIVETSVMVIQQIAEEEKQRKEEEKARKKENKERKQR
jgi:hypothetical protein